MIGKVFVQSIGPPDAKILICGEAPGEDEEIQLEPFVGRAGQKLMETFARYGVDRDQLRLVNLCPYRPQGNKFELIIGSPELESGIEALKEFVQTHQPNVIAALGNFPLSYLTGKSPISKYRGSILTCHWRGCENVKVIGTYHPSYILRNPGDYPQFAADIQRIIEDSEFKETRYPERNYFIPPHHLFQLSDLVEEFKTSKYLACDIESVKGTRNIICHGFSDRANRALVLPHLPEYYTYIDQLYRSDAEKVFHFGMFDTEMLSLNGFEVKNWTQDTFAMAHVLEPELPRGLDFLTSTYTREPYYKQEGRGEIPDNTKVWSEKADKNKLYIYNAKDACVTFELFELLKSEIDADDLLKKTYETRMNLTPIALEIGRNGMLVDQEKRVYLENALTQKWAKLQLVLNTIAGKPVNVNSPPGMKWFFYEKLGLPTRRKRGGGVTTDEDAVVSLIGFCVNKIDGLKTERAKSDWGIKKEACRLVLEIRGLRKLLSSYINIDLSADGRARSTYYVSGTDTGRWSCSKYLDDTGLNAQTFPREELVLPDKLEENFDVMKWASQLDEKDRGEVDGED